MAEQENDHRRRVPILIIREVPCHWCERPGMGWTNDTSSTPRLSCSVHAARAVPLANRESGDCHDPDCDHCRAHREYGTSWSAHECINLGQRITQVEPERSWRPSDRSAS